jgi:peptidyl-prolyl cis-trans isomerase C
MSLSRYCAVFLAALALAACQPKGDAANGKTDVAGPVATIDGKPISRDLFDFFAEAATGRAAEELDADTQQRVLDTLINLQVLAAQAQKEGLDKKGELAAQVEFARIEVLQRAITENYLEGKAPTEQELRAEYDAQVAQLAPNEYRARHILVPTEVAATQVLDRLKRGERFEVLARDSLDSSRDRGGDLGWFSPTSMVKPFADAVMALKKGETIAKPVQTQFGWHVIRLDDIRPVEPPPFDQVQQQVSQAVLAKKLRAYTDELVKAYKIEKKL